MTLSTLRTDFYTILKRSSTSFSTTLANFCINAGIKFIAGIYTFTEMKAEATQAITLAGGARYNYPARMKELYAIQLIDGTTTYSLDCVPVITHGEEYKHKSVADTGRPASYTDRGSQYELSPPPDGAYTLYLQVSQYPVALALDADVSILVDKDELLLASAVVLGFGMIRDFDSRDMWKDILATLLSPYVSLDKNKAWAVVAGKGTQGVSFRGDYWKTPLKLWERRRGHPY